MSDKKYTEDDHRRAINTFEQRLRVQAQKDGRELTREQSLTKAREVALRIDRKQKD